MLQDSKGHRLYRRVEIKVVFPKNTLPPKTVVQRAPAGKGINEEGINEILLAMADQLENLYPWWEFEYIEVTAPTRTARFVFSFKGYSTKNPQPTNSSTPAIGAGAEALASVVEAGNESPISTPDDAVPATGAVALSPITDGPIKVMTALEAEIRAEGV